MYEFFGKEGRLILCFCIKCTINPRPNPYSGVPAVRVFFLEVLATFKLLPTGLTQPRTLGLFCGPSRPTPGPFLLCEKKWEKKAHQGFYPWTPYLLVTLNKRRLAVLASFLIIICRLYKHGNVQGKQGYARPSPPQGEVGLPAYQPRLRSALPNFRALSVRASATLRI